MRTAIVGVDEARGALERRLRVEQRRDQRGVAEQKEFAVGVARQRELRAGNDHGRAMVSPHRIERNADLVRH